MPFESPLEPIQIPECNILSYLFPNGSADETPLWLNAEEPKVYVSAADTLSLIRRLAVGLDKLRIPSQKAIMVISPNHIYLPVLYLASGGTGRFFTAANPSYTVRELVYQMRTIEAALVLVHPSVLDKGIEAASQANVPLQRIYQFSDKPCETSSHGVLDWRSILASEQASQHWKWDPLDGKSARETIAVVNFSSGTTGLPKGVCTSHYNVVANASQVIQARYGQTDLSSKNTGEHRWLAYLPWYHAYAQLFSIVITCKLRQQVYTMSQFKLDAYLKHISGHRITSLQVVPPTLVTLNKAPELANSDVSTVKYAMSAAAPLKNEIQESVAKRLGAVVAQSWGMTETTCTGLMVPGEEQDKGSSVGCLLPNTEAKLIDDEGHEASSGSSGELWIRGPQMMMGYWRREEATKETLTVDGWLKTGDIAEHRDGRWWIVDRRKELIKVRGFQVAPAELEALLLEHEDVADAAVVGLPSSDEEKPRAYIVLGEAAKCRSAEAVGALHRFVEERVARQKRLTGGIAVVKAIPRLLSGKIQRKEVKEWAKRDAAATSGRIDSKL